MSDYETPTEESSGTDIEDRTRRALERHYSVLHIDGTPIEKGDDPSMVAVFSGNSAREHRVDVAGGRCTCEDHEYRGVECAHIRRARIALGRQAVATETLAAVDVHSQLAANAPGPVVATSDGGVVGGEIDDESDDSDTDGALDPQVREHVEQHGTHDYAGVSRPPADDGPTNPTRSEPADFGGGETTGVQDL